MTLVQEQKAKTLIDRDALCGAVDQVIAAYLNSPPARPCVTTKSPCNPLKCRMMPEINTRVEVSLDMKNSAATSTLRNITQFSCPHFESIKWIINDLLISRTIDYGLVSEIFARMRYYHPVYLHHEYYRQLLDGLYVIVKKNTLSEHSFFWFVVNEMSEILKNQLTGKENSALRNSKKCNADFDIDESCKIGAEDRYFHTLETSQKLEKLKFCLILICDWLDDDLTDWAIANDLSRRSLTGLILWPDSDDEGKVTSQILTLFGLLRLYPEFQRLLQNVAELVRRRDRCGVQMYPFLGCNSNDLAREVSARLLPTIKDNSIDACKNYLWGLNPDWLRLGTISYMLTDLTGFQCVPELSSAVTIMEHLEYIFKVDRRNSRKRIRTEDKPADPAIVKKFLKLKSVNLLFRSGMTRLHTSCHNNNEEEVRALLTFPLLDVNLPDSYGRTALLEACRRGSVECVRLLLAFSPPVGSTQRRASTRAPDLQGFTPLMVAAQQGHSQICNLLLQHSGSVLLDDVVSDNQTAMDLCTSEETRHVLQKYKRTRIETIYSTPELTLATGDYLLVAQLCVLLIQSYMDVHRTWEIYHALKRNARHTDKPTLKTPTVLCEYSRYHRDFRTYVNKIRTMAMKLKKISQIASVTDVLQTIVSLNK